MRKIFEDLPMLFAPNPWEVKEMAFTQESNSVNETIFTIANGYIGIRGFFEEGFYGIPMHTMRTTMINGIYEYFPYHHIWCRPGFPSRYHSILNQTDPLDLKVYVDGEKVILGPQVSDYSRTLYMKSGEVIRKFAFKTAQGKEVKLAFHRFCSQTERYLAFMKLDVESSEKIDLRLVSTLASIVSKTDSAKAEIGGATCDPYHFREVKRDENKMIVGYDTNTSGFEVTCGINETIDPSFEKRTEDTEDTLVSVYENHSFSGSFSYERDICFTTNREFKNHVEVAIEKLNSAKALGYDASLEETRKKWSEFWRLSGVEITKDDAISQGIHFSMFHIYQSTGKDGITNISANGLTGTGYSGHTFWDTEIFMMPMYIYTDPSIAKELLMYRYNILPNAKKRAKEMDGVGALYAWNSINGEECGHVFEAVTAQYHIDDDIYYAIQGYFYATGDEQFMVDYGIEMLFEMSKFMAHRGSFIANKGGKFCLNVVCGPDEYNPIVDNNLFTNDLAKRMFEFSLTMRDLLKEKYPQKLAELKDKCEIDDDEFALWDKAAKKMYMAYSSKLGMYMQDDNFIHKDPIDVDSIPVEKLPLLTHLHPLNLWRYQVCKQADIVLLTFLRSQDFTLHMRKKIFDYYEPKTIHDSSLSAGIHSIVACDIGYGSEAYGYLKQSCRMDLDNVNRNTYFGIHAACMGTSWMMIVNGYGGLRVYDNVLHFKPYCDPKWKSIAFNVLFHGSLLRTEIFKDKVIYSLLSGDPLTFFSGTRKITLKKDGVKEVQL